jgi:hypothetical protein
MQGLRNNTTANVTANTSFNTDAAGLEQVQNYSIQAKWTVPAAIVFAPTAITVAAKTITKASHGLITGSMVRMTTATTLPAGITNATTDYFVIKVDADTIKLSDTKAHALAGTNIVTMSDQGTGNHTLTVTTLNISIQPEISNDPDTVGWISYGSATVATAAGNVAWDIPTDYKWARLAITWTAGQVTFLAVDAGQG